MASNTSTLQQMARKNNNKKRASQKKANRRTNDRRNIWLIIITALLMIGSIILFVPPQEKINQGLDIQGGLSVVLTAKSDSGEAITPEEMEASRAIIESRVNALGANEATVQLQGNDQILVQIPGLSDTETALETIGRTGSLVFARLDSFTDEEVKTQIEEGRYGSEGTVTDDFGNVFPTGKVEHLYVEPGTYTPLVTGDEITNVTIGQASEAGIDYAVNVTLDSQGAAAFAAATEELAPSHGKIVIILDNEVQSAPAVQSEIPDGRVSITGNYDLEEARSLQTILQSGSLPVSFEYAQSQVVGPTLGQDALFSGVMVALIGLVIVMLYLLFFYKGLGLITAAAMVVFAVLYLGILALLSLFGQFSLTLAGIAGIVLTIGMAADSSILTLERFREEIRMGRSVRAASLTGVRHAIETSIDADLVTMVSALSLFFLAAASVKGFGLTLALGIICDIMMMLIFKAPIIRLLAPVSIARHPGFWGITDSQVAAKAYEVLAKSEGTSVVAAEEAAEIGEKSSEAALAAAAPKTADAQRVSQDEKTVEHNIEKTYKLHGRFIKHDINFLDYRRIFLTVAAVLIALCFVVVGVRGLNFGIEFIGGTSIAFNSTGDITIDQMRDAFDAAGEPDAVIQTTVTNGDPGFLVRTTTTSAETAAANANSVASSLGLPSDSFEVTTIGPDWGASVIQSSLIAFLVSIVLIIIYIAIRFEYKMGVIAVVALLHDLILVMGIYALVGREVNPNTIAALLTILGYSLYDTVVVFHRINDNMKGSDIKCTFMTMANHSINQVLIRTINTTLTSLIPVLAMLLFGSETLKDFAFAMVIGLICGSYSSIAIATPLFAIWKTHEKRYAKLRKRYGDKIGRFEFEHILVPAGSPHVEISAQAMDEVLASAPAEAPEKAKSEKGAPEKARPEKEKPTAPAKETKAPKKPVEEPAEKQQAQGDERTANTPSSQENEAPKAAEKPKPPVKVSKTGKPARGGAGKKRKR